MNHYSVTIRIDAFDDSRKRQSRDRFVNSRVTSDQRNRIEAISAKTGKSLSEIGNEALCLYLEFWPDIHHLFVHSRDIKDLIN